MQLYRVLRPMAAMKELIVIAKDVTEARWLIRGLGNPTKIEVRPVKVSRARILGVVPNKEIE